MNKRAKRQQMLSDFVKRIGAPLVYVNQVGANDEILFDGASLVCSARGEILHELPSFREGLADFDLDLGSETGVTEVASSLPGTNRRQA